MRSPPNFQQRENYLNTKGNSQTPFIWYPCRMSLLLLDHSPWSWMLFFWGIIFRNAFFRCLLLMEMLIVIKINTLILNIVNLFLMTSCLHCICWWLQKALGDQPMTCLRQLILILNFPQLLFLPFIFCVWLKTFFSLFSYS